jgi:hypothetical protein
MPAIVSEFPGAFFRDYGNDAMSETELGVMKGGVVHRR